MPATKKKTERSGITHIFNNMLKEIGKPVDFELPDWLNKWNPMSYTFIKRNIYLTKRIKRRLEDDGIFCSCSSSIGSSGVCGRDCLCGILQSSCSAGCKCGTSCLNKPFHQRPVKKMKIVKLKEPWDEEISETGHGGEVEKREMWTEKCGSGIVADEDVKQGEFVIEYVGEDQDCHCGAAGCRQKLGVKPNKPKLPSSDAALKIVAYQVAVTSPKVKAILSRKDVRMVDKLFFMALVISASSAFQSSCDFCVLPLEGRKKLMKFCL
ncbi:unnamed protein product [Ilex paraguariensis]|uniref:Histone-lysine N-methyltransferase n=1 Tax=Ilex paraguariensis TaxID=185542 RepID=A0ABC8RVP5_9AQUA